MKEVIYIINKFMNLTIIEYIVLVLVLTIAIGGYIHDF